MSFPGSGILARLRPRTLAGQTILVVAFSLFLVELIGFSVYYLAQRNQELPVAAAPGVIVILEALDQRDRPMQAVRGPFDRVPFDRARLQRGIQSTAVAPPRFGDDAPVAAIVPGEEE